jgi:hypothetical protein
MGLGRCSVCCGGQQWTYFLGTKGLKFAFIGFASFLEGNNEEENNSCVVFLKEIVSTDQLGNRMVILGEGVTPVFRIRIRIGFGSGQWIRIRIQEGRNDPQK